MTTCVVDASAVAAVLFREPDHALVTLAIPMDAKLVAPALLPLEVANVARTKVRRGELARADAETLLTDLARWRVRTVPVPWAAAWKLAWTHGLTIYDAAYLHVAITQDALLVTLDGDLRKAAGKRARP